MVLDVISTGIAPPALNAAMEAALSSSPRSGLSTSPPRHLHNKGRKCSPKKGGGGGKGTWGKAGDEQKAELTTADPRDPNFDPSENSIAFKISSYPLNVEEIETLLEPSLQEYFTNGDTDEFQLACSKLNVGSLTHKIPEMIIRDGIERKASERELASNLLSELYGNKTFSESDLELACESLLQSLDDLKLDTPDAPDVLGRFLARAVADDCLPPAFINSHPGVQSDYKDVHLHNAIKKARTLLHMGMAHLDQVWGETGPRRPVQSLKTQMQLMLHEYVQDAQDVLEAERCLRDLEVPHFHHEIVYESIVLAVESLRDNKEGKLIRTLLKHFADTNVVTPNQMTKGFKRVFDSCSDLALDNPSIYNFLTPFVDQCVAMGIVENSALPPVPQRPSRKRYLSENDGGRMKN